MATMLALCACGGTPAESGHVVSAPPGISSSLVGDSHILIDQFGYLPADAKIAVIRSPKVGYDSARTFTPGDRYQLRQAADGAVVFSGRPTAWADGKVEASSGDRGWWFDFSSFSRAGEYFVYDVTNRVRSDVFRIDPDVYNNVLKAAVRMYFYQRSGFAKRPPFVDACWADEAAYTGPDQDLAARDITDRDNSAKFRNVFGGWFDAGDTNKYVTFAARPVHQLLTAYQTNHAAFTDDFGIPESGNGIPDLLDEVNWEIDWLARMQNKDGSAALKVGEIVDAPAAPPSADHSVRYYIPACTSSTIAIAGVFAHASYVFGSIPKLTQEANMLRARASAAWNAWQRTNPKQEHCDTGVIRAGNADWSAADQSGEAVTAAVYLLAITALPEYDLYVRTHLHEAKPYRDIGWSRYDSEQGEALLFYTTLATADPTTRTAILADKSADVNAGNRIYGFQPDDDLYQAFMHDPQYHWGSNSPRAEYGNTNLDAITYGVKKGAEDSFRQRALGIVHYFHGVNPLGMVYLSNMYQFGASRSANEIYHTWFANGTKWSDSLTSKCGPPPGYIPGGPNASAGTNGVPGKLMPPVGQPPQKSYLDWNKGWPESSWAITEPGIYYQAAYIRLLSYFVHPSAPTTH
jgi:endoglucanase